MCGAVNVDPRSKISHRQGGADGDAQLARRGAFVTREGRVKKPPVIGLEPMPGSKVVSYEKGMLRLGRRLRAISTSAPLSS